MTKREALVAVFNMAKRVQLDHTYKGGKYHRKYMRQRRAMQIIKKAISERAQDALP